MLTKTQTSSRSISQLFSPLGILFFHSIPQLLLFLLWSWTMIEYRTYIPDNSWPYFTIGLLIIVALFLGSALSALLYQQKKSPVPAFWLLVSLTVYAGLIFLFHLELDNFRTHGLPNWQQPRDVLFYTVSFLIPAILHSLSLLALGYLQKKPEQAFWVPLLKALIPPIISFLTILLIFSLRFRNDLTEFIAVLAIVMGTISTFFFLFTAGIQLVKKRINWRFTTSLYFFLTAILPVACLIINNTFDGNYAMRNSGIFGDFNHPLFYVLAIINGTFLSFPLEKRLGKATTFLLRAALFPFSLYFFLILAPFLPFSLLLAFFFGLGLLLWVPIIVIWRHGQLLLSDLRQLRQQYSLGRLLPAAALALFLLPGALHLSYLYDRQTLHTTLDYLENPSLASADIHKSSLERALRHIWGNKESSDDWFGMRHTPLLTPWFTQVVLDGLSLSDSKMKKIETIFFNRSLHEDERIPPWWAGFGRPESGGVQISLITSETQYHEEGGYFTSQIDLELTNCEARLMEYHTAFPIPEGTFVSDYYLYVGEEKKNGLLVERKAATWVYDQITRTRRDPGLLRYLPDGRLELRVFPFNGHQTRKTGFTLIHPEPLQLSIDQQTLCLGNPQMETKIPDGYLPAAAKAQLPLVKRKGYFHFLIDASESKTSDPARGIKSIEQLMEKYPQFARQAKLSLVNQETITIGQKEDWQDSWKQHPRKGGFFLERALEQAFLNIPDPQHFPIPVVISPAMDQAVLPTSLASLQQLVPELDRYFHLRENGQLTAYSLKSPVLQLPEEEMPFQFPEVRAYTTESGKPYFFSDNGEGTLLPEVEGSENLTAWQTGRKLMLNWQAGIFQPAAIPWAEQVRNSFAAGILSPHTAFMVVEEAWQEDMLLKKQEQFLNGHAGLDGGEELSEMPEPGFWLMLFCMLAFLLWRYRQQIGLRVKRL